jgi:pimeloyl-ACP methyl ester carboxylesterase
MDARSSEFLCPQSLPVVAPRAPTDTWNLWHEGHIDPMFARLIDDFVAVRGVAPAKVYLLGYSAGGDGVWQLAPRMPDRFAAASMMAGHPNGVNTLGVRNLPFAMFVGSADAGYNRNKVVAGKIAEFDLLRQEDPEGYEHLGRVYEGLPHWMNLKDAGGIRWGQTSFAAPLRTAGSPPQPVLAPSSLMAGVALGTDKLCKKPVDEGVVLGDRLPHEDGEAVGGGGGG